MTVSLSHTFSCGIADDSAEAAAGKVLPSHWNATHTINGMGAGVLAALGIDIGSAGALITFGGALGTPSSGVATNLTGTASGLTAGAVTTNANLTGPITSSGNATSIASQTGTGTKFVVDTSPTLITPILGVASATSLAIASGSEAVPGVIFPGNYGFYLSGANIGISYNGTNTYSAIRGGYFTVSSDSGFNWTSVAGHVFSGTPDTTLTRNAAGVVQFGTTGANSAGSCLATSAGLGPTPTLSASTMFNISAGTTAISQMRFAGSTAPTSPVDGDFWFDGTNVKIRVSGATKTFTLI